MNRLLFFLIFIISSESFATVRVAFLEAVNRNGLPVQLSPGEQFYHVAIEVDGLWYDSLPKRQVIGRAKLQIPSGTFLSLVVEHADIVIPKERVRRFVGWEFDFSYSWTKSGKTYCSRLVANILGVEPSPMLFMGPHWRMSNVSKSQAGKLGISPDELLGALKEMNFDITYDRRRGYQKKRKPTQAAGSCSSIL